jgi:NAD+ kinase
MKLGIIANINRPHARSVVDRVLRWCADNNQDYYLSSKLEGIGDTSLPFLAEDSMVKECDYFLSMGGDGTMLATTRLVGKNQIPILGINIGSLGFLTEEIPADMDKALKRLQDGDFEIEERIILEACLENSKCDTKFYALNDFVIDKGKISRMISLSLSANGDYICSYNADGLIISSPTGSTAYSLAVGGPILNPIMKAMIASPIAPHSLASRPMIFPHNDILEVKVEFSHEYAILTADGQVDTRLPTGASVHIKVADHVARLIRFPKNSFYSVLRSKLQWGVLPKTSNENNN